MACHGGRSYTRAGLFGFDLNGMLTDSSGNRVQGFGVDPLTGSLANTISDIVVTPGLSPPQATENLSIAINLDANSPILAGFSLANTETTSNARVTKEIFDSLGAPRDVTVFFEKTAANLWNYHVTLAAADAAVPGPDPFVLQATGNLQFDTESILVAINGGTTDPTITLALNNSNGAAASQSLVFSLGQIGPLATGQVSTQFQTDTETKFVSQDGFSAGSLTALGIDDNGRIRSSSFENSNVDLAQQFVKLMLAQRAFQANTRTASVANELLANLVALGQ